MFSLPTRAASTSVLAAFAALSLVGCDSMPEIDNPFAKEDSSTFFQRVEANCSDYPVGGSDVADLLQNDEDFQAAARGLYDGTLSVDAFSTAVAQRHPADDANVAATGCIADQLLACKVESCRPLSDSRSGSTDAPEDFEPEAAVPTDADKGAVGSDKP